MPTVPPEVEKVIDMLKQRVASMQESINILEKEFGIQKGQSPPKKKKSKRREQLVKFLSKNGPSSRKEIEEGTAIPIGTLATLLNDKKSFMRLESGKWQVAENQ